ncbi:MAG: DNA-binding response regulator [Sandaracinus sp.]|nr:DNA-binding response regulator [Sandaracinus sp.]|tara:strand:- start:5045 stop:5713 length:669 start_codon:yes stop_codon:yes gene_type:complete
MKVLLVEDDEALGGQVVGHLEGIGCEVEWLQDGDAARGVPVETYALIVLDLMLPGTYGMDLLKIYRNQSDVPVLVLSARQDTADKVRALKLGADDYLTKPFWPEELVARVRARLRRPELRREDGRQKVGAIVLDSAARTVEVEGQMVDLTKAEMDVLLALAKRPGSAMTRRALVTAALEQGSERTLDVHVSRLRKKLGDAGAQIATVWGIGYKLLEEVDDAK